MKMKTRTKTKTKAKTQSKLLTKPHQNQYQHYQNHIKINTTQPKHHKNQEFHTKTSKLVLILVHA